MTIMQPEMLPKVWDDIIDLHWQYLETDENLEKLHRRKKLEVRLKEFLCMIQPDRKFFLPVTAQVLKVSLKTKDFSACKALIGFESISQYANNLFTKPWRKEYRTIKTYSGFYQHEIADNLKDAEKLFLEMGYKLMPNQTLILDGPICPDQVSNVSRDAMIAYVECQIINEIYCGLIKMQLSIPWPNILNFRELHIGHELDAIKTIALSYRRQHSSRDKSTIATDNLYNGSNTCSSHQNTSQSAAAHSSSANNFYQHAGAPPPPPPPPLANGCAAHAQQSSFYGNANPHMTGCGAANNLGGQSMAYAYGHSAAAAGSASNHQSAHLPLTLPHSKSLDHYGDHHSNQPRYSSFDHQYYENNRSTCECVDGYQTCAPINQFYNIPGSRSALPFSLSNHMLTGVPQTSSNGVVLQSCNSCHTFSYPPASTNEYGSSAASGTHHHHAAAPQHHGTDPYCRSCDGNMFRQSSSIQQLPSAVSVQSSGVTVNHYCDNAAENYVANNGATVSVAGYHSNAKNCRPISTVNMCMDRLIDFDDRPMASGSGVGAGIYANSNKSDYFDRKQYRMSDNNANAVAAAAAAVGEHIDRSCMLRQRHSSSQPQSQITQLSSEDIDLAYAKCVKQHGAIPALTAIIKKLDYDQVDGNHDDDDDNGGGGALAATTHLCPTNSGMGKRPFLPSSSSYGKTDKYKINADLLAEYEALHINNGGSRNSRESDFNSYDDCGTDYTNHTTPTTTAANSCKSQPMGSMSNKNQDGVGSYESWDFVYKILERQGYNKERGDLLVRGLDLNPIPDANAEKKIFWDEDGRPTTVTVDRRAGDDDAAVPAAAAASEFLHADVRHETIKPPEHYDGVIPPPIVGRENGKVRTVSGGVNGNRNGVRISNGKYPVNGSSGETVTVPSQSKAKNSVPLNHLENCQAVDAERRQLQEQQLRQQQQQQKALAKRQQVDTAKEALASKHYSSTTVVKENGTATALHRTAHNRKSTGVGDASTTTTTPSTYNGNGSGNSSNNEWSCKFCTFLNPSSKRICNMCSKSKDFNLDAPKKSTATCI